MKRHLGRLAALVVATCGIVVAAVSAGASPTALPPNNVCSADSPTPTLMVAATTSASGSCSSTVGAGSGGIHHFVAKAPQWSISVNGTLCAAGGGPKPVTGTCSAARGATVVFTIVGDGVIAFS